MYICICMHIYIYIYIYRERESSPCRAGLAKALRAEGRHAEAFEAAAPRTACHFCCVE